MIPAILAIPASQREFLHAVTMLVARLGRPFIFFAPTAKHYGLSSEELLANLGSVFLPLDASLTLNANTDTPAPRPAVTSGIAGTPAPRYAVTSAPTESPTHPLTHSPTFSPVAPPSTLFAGLVPQIPEQPDQDLASRVCLVLDEIDGGSRRKNPSLTTVFRLYYVQELPMAQIAKKCRCSAGTIMNRLNLLQAKTGATPAQLRRIGPHFTQFHEDLSAAKSDYHRRRKYNL